MTTEQLWHDLFALSPDIRYVALRTGDDLEARQRAGIRQASASESDRYEEWLVNPTILTLVRERGRIDCGGLEFVVIRYGHFFQLVHPVTGGHLSIAVEPNGDPVGLVPRIRDVLTRQQLWPVVQP